MWISDQFTVFVYILVTFTWCLFMINNNFIFLEKNVSTNIYYKLVDIIQEVPIEVTLYALFAISYSTYGNRYSKRNFLKKDWYIPSGLVIERTKKKKIDVLFCFFIMRILKQILFYCSAHSQKITKFWFRCGMWKENFTWKSFSRQKIWQ